MKKFLMVAGLLAAGGMTVGWIVQGTGVADATTIANGRALFEHEWQTNDPLCGDGDGLGPVFNAQSCVACHFQGGVGGSGPETATVTTFQIVDRNRPDTLISSVVHKHAVDPSDQENSQSVRDRFANQVGFTNRAVQTIGGCTVTVNEVNPILFHKVDSPPLFGLALIESISDWTLFRMSASRMGSAIAADFRGDFKRNGKGVASMMSDGRVGKFGWKGQFASIDEFIANACAMELGLSNQRVAQPLAGQFAPDDQAKPDMTSQQLWELTEFVRSLPRPEQIMPTDPAARDRVIHGEAKFTEARCTDCHIKKVGDVDGIYTDFLLYEIDDEAIRNVGGGGYGMGSSSQTVAEFDWPSHLPAPGDWQTPPLWGVADSAPYLHDGSAPTLAVAIARHHGDADFSRKRYDAMPASDQQAVLEFLGSLRAPRLDGDPSASEPGRSATPASGT